MSQPDESEARVAKLERKVEALKGLLAELAEDKASVDRALQAEQQRHESLVARLPWLVVRFDSELRYSDANHAFRSLLSNPDLLGQPLGGAGEWKSWIDAARSFRASEEEQSREQQICIDLDGADRFLLLCFSRTNLDDHITVVGMDQTERNLALETAEHEAQRADAANRAKSEFLAVMSHEIRTPLNGVLGMVELLGDTSLDPEQSELVSTLGDCGRSLHLLIDDILDLTKIDAGAVEFESIPVEPRTVLRGVADLFRARASASGLELTVDAAPSCPRTVLGDPTRLRQVLSNLVNNAIKFTEHGGVTLRVRACEEGSNLRLHFEVEDTGIGVTDEQACNVFNAFTQADGTTTRKFGGTGLGLAIAKRLVEGMGGTIAMTRSAAGGALVRFDIRALPDERVPDGAPHLQIETLETRLRDFALRVLVAEDNRVNQRIAQSFLERLGCEVVVVGDGRAAVDAVASSDSFDLVLMDVDMPVLDGIGATLEIRALEGDAGRVPIVAMTANVVAGDRQACLDAGMGGWLGKPFTREGMSQALIEVAEAR